MSRIEEAIEKASRMRKANGRGDKVNVGQAASCSADGQAHAATVVERKAFRRKGGWMLGGAFTLAVIVSVYFLYHGNTTGLNSHQKSLATAGGTNRSEAAARQESVSLSRKNGLRIPTTFLSGSPDPSYSTNHPGWQRYISDEMEVRVYREGNTVKAIQVISLVTEGISDDYLNTFLNKSVGSGAWTIQSREEKDGYSIDKGSANEETEVLVYRKKPEGGIKAFVIAYS